MNTSTIRVLALSLIAMLAPLSAMAQAPANFTVPFDFTVGQHSFAAGHYRIRELAPSIMLISGDDGRAATAVLTIGDEPGKIAGQVTMTFNRYGERYFLAKVTDYNHSFMVPPSKGEKVLIANRTQPSKPLAIMASAHN